MARVHTSIHAFILSWVVAIGIVGAAACQDVRQRAREAEERTRDERAAAQEKARELGRDAARAVNQAGEELAERSRAAWETIDVKGALMADASVDATRIDVDTDYKTRTVTLDGFVPTETEKNMAEVIAKARADGFTVVNTLHVRPRG